jgi:hypothetical protein
MGIGGFLASQSERDHYRFLRHHTAARVVRSCVGELEREVYAVLGPVGVDEKASRAVAKCLRDVELSNDGASLERESGGIDQEHGELRWKNDVGLTAFLMKFGEGKGSSYQNAVVDSVSLTRVQRKFLQVDYIFQPSPSAWVT